MKHKGLLKTGLMAFFGALGMLAIKYIYNEPVICVFILFCLFFCYYVACELIDEE